MFRLLATKDFRKWRCGDSFSGVERDIETSAPLGRGRERLVWGFPEGVDVKMGSECSGMSRLGRMGRRGRGNGTRGGEGEARHTLRRNGHWRLKL